MEDTSSKAKAPAESTFFARHQFLIYRLFSLAGLLPIGGYMVIHLLTNMTVINGPATFQSQVDRIHSLGHFLVFVEWTFIFIPILFHATIGWLIISGAVPNTSSYPYRGNVRYVLQRATGIIAFFFIAFHIIQLHHLGSYVGGGQFDPEHAASSTAIALKDMWAKVLYATGILACSYHLANGIWTGGITWGLWVTANAQRRASVVALLFGLGIATVGLSALGGMSAVDVEQARVVESRMETNRKEADGELATPEESPAEAADGTSARPSAATAVDGVATTSPAQAK